MRKFLLYALTALASFVGLTQNVNAEELVIKGTYQGENIYVKNPLIVLNHELWTSFWTPLKCKSAT